MTRPRIRMLFAAVIICAAFWIGLRLPSMMAWLGAVAFAAILGSIVLGRDFFRGRAAMRRREYREAIASFEKFVTAQSSPRVRLIKFLWLGFETLDPVAIAYNNIGVCFLNLRNLPEAAGALEKALSRDAQYAIPHVNLAILFRLLNDSARSKDHASVAVRLGYRESALDVMVRRALAAHSEAVGRRV